MAQGLFTLRQQVQGIVQKAWNTTVNPLSTPAVDYLVVAGGGGGSYLGGGGGAGGLLQGSVPVASGSAITVTVGSGGAGGTGGSGGASGTDSVFGAISATGGGAGGSYPSTAGASGGSGGGGQATEPAGTGNRKFGQGILGQGNAGGQSANGGDYRGGGGGGAGTVGLTAAGGVGNGGAGISSAISGTVTPYAGGGGGAADSGGTGGSGGVGGGGAGGVSRGATGGSGTVNGVTGSANTGGGGGGFGVGGAGGTGGSGIVILSYPDIYAAAAATTGSPTVSTSGSGSINFVRASSQYLTFSNSGSQFSFGTGAFTIECWVNPTTLPSSTGYPAGYWMFGGGVVDSNTGIDFYINNTQIGFNLVTFLTPTVIGNHGMIANSWYHVAVVRGGTSNQTVSIYVNGARVATATSVTDTADPSLTGISISAAEPSGATSGNFNGYISNHRIVKGTAVYDPTLTTLTVPTTPLTAITNTQLLLSTVSGAQFADSSTNSLTATALGSPTWNQSSPFATGLGYKNRVYTYTGSGTITF